MKDHSEVFVALDVAKLTNAVAMAEVGRDGEVRYLGEIRNTGRGSCPNHGGLSSGPKTAAGRERIAEAQRARWTRWRSKRLLKGLK